MKKGDLNLFLNIMNILLCLSTYITLLVCFIIFSIVENSVIPTFFILLCVLAKIFLLYILFSTFERFYPHSTLTKVLKELKTNSSSRKSALLLAFSYDVIIMLYIVLFFSLKEYRIGWAYIPVYEIITLGGMCMFYIALFGIWKLQDKLKNRHKRQGY